MIVETFLELCVNVMPVFVPAVVLFFVLYSIVDTHKNGSNYTMGKNLKHTLCIFLSVSILTFIFVQTAIQIAQVAEMWTKHNLDNFSKLCAFFGVIGTWQIIGVLLVFVVWKLIYMKQLVPGNGSLKERINTICRENMLGIILAVVVVIVGIVFAIVYLYNGPIGIPTNTTGM
jgi:hypothetical protein